MAQRHADFEIGLRWLKEQQALDVGLRFVLPDSPVDQWKHLKEPLKINLADLARKANQLDDYAKALTKVVFAQDEIAEFYTTSRAAAREIPIHLRINLDGPPALHRVRWELLRDPAAPHPVATTDHIFFSRYLASPDFRGVPWRTRQAARALVVVAGPTDLHEYAPGGRRLAEVDVEGERARAEAALKGIETVYLAGPGAATLASLAKELEQREPEQEVDILYLVCHGALTGDVPFVLLEKEDGTADPIDGRRLEEMVFSLGKRPTLAVLISCQSATEGGAASTADDGVLAGLGPRLAGAGIAAVIAMQGNVSMQTAQSFTTKFFAEFQKDGVVDKAVAVARRTVRNQQRADWWVPVLFSRLRSGRTFFKSEFTERAEATWDALKVLQKTGLFTPVLGPGLADAILGSRKEIAQRWVNRWQMPVNFHNRGDLARVAQYLRVEQKAPGMVSVRVMEYLQEELSERRARATSEEDPFFGLDPALFEGKRPERGIMAVGQRLLEDPGDPYRTVAAMPVPVFVTTGWTQLLEQALEARNPKKTPRTIYFPWTDQVDWPEPPVADNPSEEEPIVYHLFGRLEDPESLVLTEDDYFAWLTAWIAKRSLVPKPVAKALTNRSLLFLGYHLADWEFRVVFESIKSFPASVAFGRNVHVGVQLSPDSQLVEPEAAQDYIESYFNNDQVNIYWAETRKFLDKYRSLTGMAT